MSFVAPVTSKQKIILMSIWLLHMHKHLNNQHVLTLLRHQ
jgi:hypothetical protein